MSNHTLYGTVFYRSQSAQSMASAETVVPPIFDLVRPRSVVDVGCGTGTWLAAARRLGAETVIGYDGAYAEDRIVDPAIRFRAVDLDLDRWAIPEKVDLAMSLECAEHVSPRAGARIVEQLCRAAPVVLFGAAIPGQGGTGHINEQWQSHWIAAFAERGYAAYDVVRPRCWDDTSVEPWYAQNTFLYVDTRSEVTAALRQRLAGRVAGDLVDTVNPRLWRATLDRVEKPAPGEWLKQVRRVPLRRMMRKVLAGG